MVPPMQGYVNDSDMISGMSEFMSDPDNRKKMQDFVQKYQPKEIAEPVEKPNIIAINKPKVQRPTRTAREALRIILDSIRPGFTEQGSLLEQGLTSLNVMQMVTRAGEHGYHLGMRDIIAEPTFDAIASKMKAEE